MDKNFFQPRKKSIPKKPDPVISQKKQRNASVDIEYEENKRERSIKDSWLKNHNWLRKKTISELYTEKNFNSINEAYNKLQKERSRNSKERSEIIEFNEVMICQPCRDRYYSDLANKNHTPTLADLKAHPFVFGAISFRIESVTKHGNSTNLEHRLSMDRQENTNKEKKNKPSDAQKIVLKHSALQIKQLKSLFINAYSILKKGKSFMDYEFLVDLDKAKGIDIGSTYLNRQAGLDFARSIDDVYMKQFRANFNKAMFFSITIDESTDASRLEQVVLHVRYSILGEVKTKFVAIDNVIRPKADQLTEKILEILKTHLIWEPGESILRKDDGLDDRVEVENEELGELENDVVEVVEGQENVEITEDEVLELFMEIDGEDEGFEGFENDDCDFELVDISECVEREKPLLVGMTTDGASVLTGRKNGVQQRVRRICNEFMTGAHCISHRLQLAIKDTANKTKELKELQIFCENLFNFHKKSTVISSVYKEVCNVLEIKGKRSVIRVNGTRWISHMVNALENLFNGLNAHIQTYNTIIQETDYSSSQKAQAKYFMKKLESKKFLSTALYLLDLCRAMSLLSKETQKENVTTAELKMSLQSALSNISRFYENPDSGLFWNKKSQYSILSEHEISVDLRKSIALSFKECLQNRCADTDTVFEEGDDILNTKAWESKNFFATNDGELQITDVYDGNIDALLAEKVIEKQLCFKGVDVKNIKSEWTLLKEKFLSWENKSSKVFPPSSWSSIWKSVKVSSFPNFIALIDFLLCHSLSSSDAERAFSAMKEVKSKKRTRLDNRLLTIQLRQYIDGPDIRNYNPKDAIDNWVLKPSKNNKSGVVGSKRPNFMDHGDRSVFKPKKQSKAIEIFD